MFSITYSIINLALFISNQRFLISSKWATIWCVSFNDFLVWIWVTFFQTAECWSSIGAELTLESFLTFTSGLQFVTNFIFFSQYYLTKVCIDWWLRNIIILSNIWRRNKSFLFRNYFSFFSFIWSFFLNFQAFEI